ncbi:uncharacterized protein LOC134205217 isoform X2 [Armigeres subalbatus]|uniref:uncharacterized protein LOC134205217 isoform X2 n=1 Tax=Armigeres subalbatus TaxID=124917 RepID=UPI002ED1FC94
MSLSSPKSSRFHPMAFKRNQAIPVAAVLTCVFLVLVPFAAGFKQSETSLKMVHDDRILPLDAKYSRITPHSRQHDMAFSRKNKSNKLNAKKYVGENADDSQHPKEKKSIYEKKYFDYLPAEIKGSPETPGADAKNLKKRTNSRRLRRDTDAAVVEQPRTKRQGWIYPNSPYRGWPVIYPESVSFVVNRPHLNNHYLPPPQPVRPVVPPSNSNQIPDRTYLPVPRPEPADEPGTFQIDNRLGGNVFAFDTVYDPSVDRNYILQQRPRPAYAGGPFQNNFPGLPAPRPISTVRPLAPGTTTDTTSTFATTTTPRPVIQNNSDDEFDWAALGLSPDAVGTRLGGDNGSSDDNKTDPNRRRTPSKCTWAIANCCSQFSDKIRYHCFEQNQCYGAFWGDNVCRAYYKLALTEIENYYSAV